ncbi:MAG TPA: flippase [Candidatus Sulfotelmatobacter sp.]|nr:flippase [Candidatus Sulfotelmatobacter sp.]
MSVKRNTLYNLLGTIAPSFVSLVTVPAYLHLIGNARYGVLAIVWLFLGYFGLFDPGITRAAAFHISRLHKPEQAREREGVFWTALVVNLAFGIVGGVVLFFVARPIFMSTFKMPESMRGEVIASLPWLAASIPLLTTTGVLTGALQAREWFGVSNSINVANAAVSQLVPLAVAYWMGPQLSYLIPATIIVRALGAAPTLIAVARALPLGMGAFFDRSQVKPLFSYGGWITLTNVLNPVLSTMDRMLIGSLLSAEAVAFYTVPFNLVSRASAVPGSLATTLFPKLSRGNLEDSARLASDALAALASVTTPMCVLGIAALPIFMHYWVGASFAQNAAPVGVVVFVGIWINGLAYIPYSHLQAIGRPDIVAKFHTIEVVPFLGMLWLGLHFFGLVGCALAWTLRVSVDAILLFVVAGKTPGWQRLIPGLILVIIAAPLAPTAILSFKTPAEIGLLIIAAIWAWKLSPQVQSTLRSRIQFLRARTAL